MKSKNLQHDDTFLNNQDEVNAFKQRIEGELPWAKAQGFLTQPTLSPSGKASVA